MIVAIIMNALYNESHKVLFTCKALLFFPACLTMKKFLYIPKSETKKATNTLLHEVKFQKLYETA